MSSLNIDEKLRPEADKLAHTSLSETQCEALTQLIELLMSALDSSSKKSTNKVSRLAFLDGEKGAGKSSLLMTIEDWVKSGKADYKKTANKPAYESLQKTCEQLTQKLNRKNSEDPRNTIHWLSPLILDPMPPGANLLGAILARIAIKLRKLTHQNLNYIGRLDASAEGKGLARFEDFQATAIRMIEGNLVEHSSRMDPDNFAVHVRELESEKVSLADDLNAVINQCLGPENQSILVLVIDDLDLRPSKAVEVLKLANMLSIPRLFFIFVGSIREMDQVLYYDVQGEFRDLLHDSNSETETEEIEAVANEISSSLIRKLVPQAQQISIKDMSVPESLKYSWASEKETSVKKRSLGDVLKHNLPVHNYYSGAGITTGALENVWKKLTGNTEGSSAKVSDEERLTVINLQSLIIPGYSAVKSQDHEPIYDGSRILESTPRRVSDVAYSLKNNPDNWDIYSIVEALKKENRSNDKLSAINTKNDNARKHIAETLHKALLSFIDEDGKLTIGIQKILRNAVEKHHIWELILPNVAAEPMIGDKIHFNMQLDIPIRGRVEVARILRHNVYINYQRNGALPKKKYLGKRTRPAFKLLHDYLVFTGQGVIAHPIEHKNAGSFAQTSWMDANGNKATISWSNRRWATFWHEDIFAHLWSEVVDVVKQIQESQSQITEESLFNVLGICWIATLIQTINSQPGDIWPNPGAHKDFEEAKKTKEKESNGDQDNSDSIQNKAKNILKEKFSIICLIHQDTNKETWQLKDAEDASSQDAFDGIKKQITQMFTDLKKRFCDGKVDDYAQDLQDTVIEIGLLFMPEVGLNFDITDRQTVKVFGGCFSDIKKLKSLRNTWLNGFNNLLPDQDQEPGKYFGARLQEQIIGSIQRRRLRRLLPVIDLELGISLLAGTLKHQENLIVKYRPYSNSKDKSEDKPEDKYFPSLHTLSTEENQHEPSEPSEPSDKPWEQFLLQVRPYKEDVIKSIESRHNHQIPDSDEQIKIKEWLGMDHLLKKKPDSPEKQKTPEN